MCSTVLRGKTELTLRFDHRSVRQVEQFLLKTHAECRCAEKYCERLKIYKISEGLYRIGDRNVFIRVGLSLLNFFCGSFITCDSLRFSRFSCSKIGTSWCASAADGTCFSLFLVFSFEIAFLLSDGSSFISPCVKRCRDTLEHYLIRHDPCRRGHDSSLSRSPTPECAVRPRLSNGTPPALITSSTPCLSHEVDRA